MNYQEIIDKRILDQKTIKIELDSDTYTKSTIFKSIYRLTDKVYFFVKKIDKIFIVYLTPKNTEDKEIFAFVDEFTNELIDQELRSIVLSETSKIRDVITTRALLSVSSS